MVNPKFTRPVNAMPMSNNHRQSEHDLAEENEVDGNVGITRKGNQLETRKWHEEGQELLRTKAAKCSYGFGESQFHYI